MKRYGFMSSLASFLLLALAAWGGAAKAQSDEDYQAFISKLRAKGATVEDLSKGGQLPLSNTAYTVKVDGERVEIYAYTSPEDATADAARISPSGGTFRYIGGGRSYSWIAPPHLYKKERLIAFYVGRDVGIITLLEEILGSQFAGL